MPVRLPLALLIVLALVGCDPHGTDEPSGLVVPGAGHGTGPADTSPDIALMGTFFDTDTARDLFPELPIPVTQTWAVIDNGVADNLGTVTYTNDTQRGVPCIKRVRDFPLVDDSAWFARDIEGRLILIRYDDGALFEPADYLDSIYYIPLDEQIVGAFWDDFATNYEVVDVGATAPNNGATDCIVIFVIGADVHYEYWSLSEGFVESVDDLDTPTLVNYLVNSTT